MLCPVLEANEGTQHHESATPTNRVVTKRCQAPCLDMQSSAGQTLEQFVPHMYYHLLSLSWFVSKNEAQIHIPQLSAYTNVPYTLRRRSSQNGRHPSLGHAAFRSKHHTHWCSSRIRVLPFHGHAAVCLSTPLTNYANIMIDLKPYTAPCNASHGISRAMRDRASKEMHRWRNSTSTLNCIAGCSGKARAALQTSRAP